MSTFDIRAAVAEIPISQDRYKFTFDLALAKKVRELRAEGDEEALADAEKALEAKTYVAEMVGVPKRRREDIYTKSLELFPGTRDFLGRVDEVTEYKRGNYVRTRIVSAGIVRILSPEGGVQDENLDEVIEYIHDEAPDQIFAGLEKKIQEINAADDEQDALNKSADF